MPKMMSLRFRITSKGVFPIPEDKSQNDIVTNGERDSVTALENVSATPYCLRKRQAAEISRDDQNVKKQKMEEVGLYKASLHAPCTTCGPMSFKEKKKLKSCLGKTVQPGLRPPNSCFLLGRTIQKECGQNALIAANHGQSLQCCCTRANDSSIKTLSDKSSKRSLLEHDHSGCSTRDCEVKCVLALPASASRLGLGYDGHRVVRKRGKDVNISITAPTAASGEDCATFTVQMSPNKALRVAELKGRLGDGSQCVIRIPKDVSHNGIVTNGERAPITASANFSATPSYPRKRQAAETSCDGQNVKKQKMEEVKGIVTNGERASITASANVSATSSYPRKRQAAEMSCDGQNVKKQKMEEVGIYQTSLHVPSTTCGPTSFKEKKKLKSCSDKTVQSGLRQQPNRCSLLGRTTQKENCGQNTLITANHRQSIQSCCTRTDVSPTPSYLRKGQAADSSCGAKKQKMEGVDLYKASLDAPCTIREPTSFNEKKKLKSCLDKTVQPGLRRPNKCSLLGRTAQREKCGQNCLISANHKQSIQSCCMPASGSSITTLSDKFSKRSLSGHDRSGCSRHDCEVKDTLAFPASRPGSGHGVVLEEEKDANISIAATTAAYGEDCTTSTIQLSPQRALRAAMLKSRFADIIFKATHQEIPNIGTQVDRTKVQKEKERLERERQKENARIKAISKAASVKSQSDSKLGHEKERAAARLALEKLERTVEIVDNFAVLKEFKALCSPSIDEYGYGNPLVLQQLGLFLKEDYLEDEECLQDNTVK